MLEVRNLCLKLDEFELKDINFSVGDGDYFIILGESGSGKSLILESLLGIYHPDQGEIQFRGKIITETPIPLRPAGIVFQDHLVFPHLTIFENIAYPLKRQHIEPLEIRKKVFEMADKLNISGLLHKKKEKLSGGELQRVALARTLVMKPPLLLLDEPLSSLDVTLKSEIRRLLRQLHREGQTIIHVTHDYEEAIALGNKVAILEKGTILQSGDIHEVFLKPKSAFVARMAGISNFFHVITDHSSEGKRIAVTDNGYTIHCTLEYDSKEGYALIKAGEITVSVNKPESSAMNVFRGVITEVADSPAGKELWIDCGIEIVALITQESFVRLQLDIGMECWVSWKSSVVKFIDI